MPLLLDIHDTHYLTGATGCDFFVFNAFLCSRFGYELPALFSAFSGVNYMA